MASSGTFCTLNPIAQLGTSSDDRSGTMSNGNLKYVNLTGNTAVGTFGVTSGKWYYEVYINSFNSDNGMSIGWVNDLFNLDAELGYNSPSSPSGAQAFALYAQNQKLIYGPGDGGSSYSKTYGSGTPTDGDIVRIWLDADNGKFWAGLNGTIYGSGDPSAGTGHGFGTGGSPHNIAISSRTLYPAIGNWSAADATVTFNFGQDSTFQGAVSAGGNTDGNGFGDFKYDPDGFLSLCTANLPTSTDIDPAETDDNFAKKNFAPILYTGTGSNGNAITGLGFQPDLVFFQRRGATGAYGNGLIDSNRGVTKGHYMNRTDAEANFTNDFASFDSDGFTLQAGSSANINNPSTTFVAWCWRANGGTTSTDSTGDITVTRQVNDASKFSICTWTGNGTSGSTLPHGLGVAPAMTWIKKRDATSSTNIWHEGYNNADPDSFGEPVGSAAWYGNQGSNGTFTTAPDATNLTLTAYGQVNGSTNTYVGYFWANVDGMQRFGNYKGNGNADGPFIYLGFKPAMIFFKRTDGTSGWTCVDTARYSVNTPNGPGRLEWNTTAAEVTGSSALREMDIFANGIKIKTSNSNINTSGADYVYGAWAAVPYKYNNTLP